MKQLTLRGFSRELERRLRELSRREGISLNRAALRLLEEAAGLRAGTRSLGKIGRRLDRFIGTGSARDEAAMRRAVRIFETVDEAFWR